MKHRILLFLLIIASMTATAGAQAVKREHRAVWMSAYVTDWPSGAITASNANTMKRACQKMLDTLAVNNMNAVYFHVRAMADALYDSAYEPWSSYCSTSRGTAPAFDPLAFIIEEAHKRGIELYAWVNPYRYKPKTVSSWGSHPLNYENAHPDWLLQTDYETVLNPGLPEVRQRVVDVCRDILTKYDIDGLVFDDYFYNQDNPSFSLDANLYNAYKTGGGTLSQGDWRRENVNRMVKDVRDMVKATKPWVRFGISPAGVACSDPNVAAKYGVDPSPGNDWQYNQIYSDPMAWISRGTIDFISPQVYWNTSQTYTGVTQWWGKIGTKFNRHVYISGYAVEAATSAWSLDEYVTQVNIMRQANENGVYGMVYFKYATWRNLSQKIGTKVQQLRQYLKQHVYTTPSLSPALSWEQPTQTYTTVTNVSLDGDTLRWSPEENVRYVVYAVPLSVELAGFNGQPEYMLGVSYSPAFHIPAAYKTGYRFAVSILDRWGNEYAPLVEGYTPHQAQKPTLLAPADGANVPRMGSLRWAAPDATSFTVQVYSDADLQNLVAHVEVDSTSIPLTAIPGLTVGQRYYWRVSARGLNLWDNISDARSFTLGSVIINSPANGAAGVSLTPTFTWNDAGTGVQYLLELSTTADMNTVRYSATTTATSLTVPQYKLAGATTYYARLTATVDGAADASPVISFQTAEVTPATPVVINPSADGQTLYGTSRVQVRPEAGIGSLRVEISTSTTFPARTSYRGVITDNSFATPKLSEITGVGALVDGKTYYLRTRYAYNTIAAGAVAQYTEYSPVMTFVYKASGIAGDVDGDGRVDLADLNAIVNIILGKNNASDYVGDADTDGNGNVDLSDLNIIINTILGQ